MSPWELPPAVTGSRLLVPGLAVEVINTNCPWWAAGRARHPSVRMIISRMKEDPRHLDCGAV